MSWTPTDEQVEKAAQEAHRAIEEHYEVPKYAVPWEALAEFEREASRKAARAVLVAVGPHIAAQAWDDACDMFGDVESASEGRCDLMAATRSANPYSEKEAGR